MKVITAILITALFITSSLTEDKEGQEIDKQSELYITNWDGYIITKPMYVIVLKDVLNKITLYQRNEYCPFKRETCEASLSDVVMKIINDSVHQIGNGNKNSSNHSEEIPDSDTNSDNKDEREIAANGEINQPGYEAEDGKLAVRIHNDNIRNNASKTKSSINDYVIVNVYNIVELNHLADVVDNKTLDEAKQNIKQLYGSYYGHLKVGKKYKNGGYIKKLPFDPHFIKPG